MCECDLNVHTIPTFVRLSLNNGRTIASATTVTDVGGRELSWWFCLSTSFNICDIKTSLFTFLPSKIAFFFAEAFKLSKQSNVFRIRNSLYDQTYHCFIEYLNVYVGMSVGIKGF